MSRNTDRRCFMARGLLAAGGALGLGSIEEQTLLAAMQDGGVPRPKPDIPPGALTQGKIRDVSVSRLVLGGNLIGGWAHARDLMYVSRLFQAYNTEAKVFETLELALECGVNTIQIDPRAWDAVLKFNRGRRTRMQTLVSLSLLTARAKMDAEIKRVIDNGATLVYSHGGETDQYVRVQERIDAVSQFVDLARAQGVPAGVGAHSLEVIKLCERHKLPADFYVKTFHIDRYWSATPKHRRREWEWLGREPNDHDGPNDNLWCLDSEETANFMATVEKPWVAFKVMAAGAIRPNVAFAHAFRNGADFVLAGMFDFQVEQDVKLAIDSVRQNAVRKRPWRG
jgi:hypothetical protein